MMMMTMSCAGNEVRQKSTPYYNSFLSSSSDSVDDDDDDDAGGDAQKYACTSIMSFAQTCLAVVVRRLTSSEVKKRSDVHKEETRASQRRALVNKR